MGQKIKSVSLVSIMLLSVMSTLFLASLTATANTVVITEAIQIVDGGTSSDTQTSVGSDSEGNVHVVWTRNNPVTDNVNVRVILLYPKWSLTLTVKENSLSMLDVLPSNIKLWLSKTVSPGLLTLPKLLILPIISPPGPKRNPGGKDPLSKIYNKFALGTVVVAVIDNVLI